MARLRIRMVNNNDWLDICQSEWHVRNAANTDWIRLTPAQGLMVRHGTNNYWLPVNCLSDDDCTTDAYGGTVDGKGTNGTGSPVPTVKSPDVGYPNETTQVNPWDPTTYVKPKPVVVPTVTPTGPSGGTTTPTTPPVIVNNTGNNSPNNPDYTSKTVDKSSAGSGDKSCPGGTYSGGTYPTGYDLPDACGANAAVVKKPDGTTVLPRPGTGVPETVKPAAPSTGTGAGTKTSPNNCPCTINSDGASLITEAYVNLGGVSGQVDIEYDASNGFTGFVIYYAGVSVADTNGHVQGTGRLSFQYDSAAGGGDHNIFIRARTDIATNTWSLRIPCPGTKNELGTLTNPAPCLGNFQPSTGSGPINEVVHDMGSTAGQVVVDYQMFNIPDQMDIFQGSTKIATTGTAVSNTGTLKFQYTPIGNNTKIMVRITSSSGDTTWAYNISCPDAAGSSAKPAPCDPNNSVKSGGAGATDIYFDLGSTAGDSILRYNAFAIPDTFDVYQGQTLIATTGAVSNEGQITFPYNPASGDVRVRVTGSGQTTWAFLVECPGPTAVLVTCGQTFADKTLGDTVVAFTAAANAFCLVEYATIGVGPSPGDGTGVPDNIHIDYNGNRIESTGVVYRYAAWGYGTLVIPNAVGINSAAVGRVAGPSWWQQTTYCPTVWDAHIGMQNFMTGMPHVFEDTSYYVSVYNGSKKIGLSADLKMKEFSCAVLMTMLNLTDGHLTVPGHADDYCALYISGPNLPTPMLVGEYSLPSVTTSSITVPPGQYFLTALLENTTSGTNNAWFCCSILDGGSRIATTTSNDWYGDYFEYTKTYTNNTPLIQQINAPIFDTVSQANTYMAANAAPSLSTIFNTWPRVNGAMYYVNDSAAQMARDAAATSWSYDSAANSFSNSINSTNPISIVSPTAYSDYVFEATLSSTDPDDDTIGLVIGFAQASGSVYSLVIARTGGGDPPLSGFGVLLVNNLFQTEISSYPAAETPVRGPWSGGSTKIRVTRAGDVFTFQTTPFGSNVYGQTCTLDLNSNPSLFRFKTSSPIGFYAYSQAAATFSNVTSPGTTVAGGAVYSMETNTYWTAVNGVWTNQGTNTAFSSNLKPYTYVVNPTTQVGYHIYNKTQRKAP